MLVTAELSDVTEFPRLVTALWMLVAVVLNDETAVERLVMDEDRVPSVLVMLDSELALEVSVLLSEFTAVVRELTCLESALRLPMISLNCAVEIPPPVVLVVVKEKVAVADAGAPEVVP